MSTILDLPIRLLCKSVLTFEPLSTPLVAREARDTHEPLPPYFPLTNHKSPFRSCDPLSTNQIARIQTRLNSPYEPTLLLVSSCRESLINQKSSLLWINGFFCLQVKRFLVGFLTLQMSMTDWFRLLRRFLVFMAGGLAVDVQYDQTSDVR